MLDSVSFNALGVPALSNHDIRLNDGPVAATGEFRPVINSSALAEEFERTAGKPAQEFPFPARVFEWASQPGDEVLVQVAENGLPLIVRRDGQVILNFDLRHAQSWTWTDSKRPIYTHVPGFDIQMVPASVRRPISNLLSSLKSRKLQDVVANYSTLPLTGFEALIVILAKILEPGANKGVFEWPHGKRAAFISLHDVDTAGFLRRREKDPLYRVEEKHGIKSTWFVVTRIVQKPSMVDFLVESGQEVGWHDYAHDHRLPYSPFAEDRARDLKNSILADPRMSPVGMRAPKLLKSNHLFEALAEHAPLMRYDTSFLRGIVPYPLYTNGKQSRLLEIPTTVPTDILLHNQLTALSGPKKFQTILDAQIARTKKLIEVGGLISIVTHPEEDLTERPELLDVYDRYLAFIKTREDVWFTTAGELFNYWTASKSAKPALQTV